MNENINQIQTLPQPTLNNTQKGKSNRKLFFILALIIFLIAVPLIFLNLKEEKPKFSPTAQNVQISGSFNINGQVPQGATISLAQKTPGQLQFSFVEKEISALDGAVWNLSQEKNGENYEIQGYIMIDGQAISSSNIIAVTAPASNEILTFNIDSSLNVPEKVSISGIFDINGYIPPLSTITLVETMEGKKDEVLISNSITASDNGAWSFKDAQKGAAYTLKAYLKNQGKNIGNSDSLIVNAPADNEVIRINSIAVPPAPTSAVNPPANTGGVSGISGSINLNGSVLANTRIVVLQRLSGTDQFYVAVDNINPLDGAVWTWNNAQSGTSYELLAVLKQKQSNNADRDLAYSQRLIVPAPASNEVLSINTGLSIPPPSSTPNVSCNNQNPSGQWNISLSYSNIPNANQYWIELGSQPGGNDVLNSIGYQSNNNPQTASAVINNNTNYYARYAYAYCSNCSNSASFSGFSNTLTFSCPQGPNPTPTPQWTGYVCVTGQGCQLSKDPNAPYSFSNQGLQLCQAQCQVSPTLLPTPTSTPTPSNTPTPTLTLTPTDTPSPTPSEPPVPTN